MRKFTVLAVLCVLLVCLGGAAFAQEQNVPLDSSFGFRRIDGALNGGTLELTVNGLAEGSGDSPAIFFPGGMEIDAAGTRYIKLSMKSDLSVPDEKNKAIKFYFRTDSAPAFSESKTVSVPLTVDSGDKYVDYLFDMGSHADWSGTVTAVFFSFNGDVRGTAAIQSIAFTNKGADGKEAAPVKKIVLTAAEKITDLPEKARVTPVSPFEKKRSYSEFFVDVPVDAWFHDAVASAYAYALVNGDSEITFNPDGTMTVAEAVTLACRLHGIAVGDDSVERIALLSSGASWYANYVDYAKKAGFLAENDFDSYDRAVTRAEMVTLFDKALPDGLLYDVNYVTDIPDVSKDAPYAAAVYRFYNAGLAMGSDIYGTFNPASAITRAEVAAIVDRVANDDHRLDKDLAVKVDPRNAYWLVDDSSLTTRNSVSQTLQSGWDFDNRGGTPKNEDEPPYNLSDISPTEPVTLTRTLTVQDAGVVTSRMSVKFNSAIDGWYAEMLDTEKLPVWRVFTQDKEYYVIENGEAKATGVKAVVGKAVQVKVTANLASRTYEVAVGNAAAGTYAFASAYASNIAFYRTGTTAEAVMDTTVTPLQMYANYAVNEMFSAANELPYDWQYAASGDVTATVKNGELLFDGASGKAAVSKAFTGISGKAALDFIMLYPEMADGGAFTLTSGGVPVVEFAAKGGKFTANGRELRDYAGYMWYMVRVIADTDTQKATVKVSGKVVAEDIPFAAAANVIDGIVISSENNGGKALRVDDVSVEQLVEAADYPSEPKVPAGADDYYIGMNVCNLWRNGHHWGWDNISPYDDNRPYLGFYDEGLPEVADWEIKFMAEHGVDFELLCWYHSGETPMKTFYGSTPKALFNGFMNAKYSDKYGRFALLWEAANGQKPSSLDDFKNRFVAFWVEYFFTDPRYMVIDNKLVMSIFGPGSLKSAFGSEEGVKEAFDYLRETVRGLGYDDIIIMACSGSASASELKSLAAMGIDAVHAYNWGTSGSSAAVNQANISAQQKAGAGVMHNVPTVSTGFNNIAWAYTRHGQMTPENMEQVLTWIRDDAFGNYTVTGKDDAWKQKFLMLSTWNEYGEGTYMMPAGLHGFGYLDSVRKVFTKGGEHVDERPGTVQLSRLGHLYPINREIIRPMGYYEVPEASKTVGLFKPADWKPSNGSMEIADGVLVGTPANDDPILTSTMPLGDLDAAAVKQAKVYVEGPVGQKVQIFFMTNLERTWSESKSASSKIEKEGMNPVIIDLASNTQWSGTIVAIRLDPVSSNASYKIGNVELLGDEVTKTFTINGRGVSTSIQSIETAQDIMTPFYPDSGIGYMLGTSYTWDKVNRRLTLAKNGVEIVYTVDSDLARVDGKAVKLEAAVSLADNIPMIPILFTARTLQCDVESKADGRVTNYDIVTIPKELSAIVAARVPNEWEFNVDADSEGWTLGNATATVVSGSFYGNDMDLKTGLNTKFDPALSSPKLTFRANDYSKLVIRMKHEIVTEKTEANKGEYELKVYFQSSAGGLSEARTFRKEIEQTSNGEYIEYVFDLVHEGWTGTISGIRVDPFNNVEGEFWIDCIRFKK